MRQTGWYRVIFNEKPQFAFYDSNGDFWYVILVMSTIPNHMITVLDEELQNPEPPKNTISDGHGNTWSKKCDVCGNDMQVVRPGSAICVKCNDDILTNDGMPVGHPLG